MKRKLIFALSLLVLLVNLPLSAAAYGGVMNYSGTSYGLARSVGSTWLTVVSRSTENPVPGPSPAQPPPVPVPTPQPPPQTVPSPQPSPPPLPTPPPSEPVGLNTEEKLLLDLVNDTRTQAGIAPLQVCPHLVKLARLKSKEMIQLNYFAHTSPTYGSFGELLRSTGYPFSLAAENIGMGGNVRSIFNAFMDSPGHRNKIMDARYTVTGIGICYQSGRGYLVTQHFARPR